MKRDQICHGQLLGSVETGLVEINQIRINNRNGRGCKHPQAFGLPQALVNTIHRDES